MVALEYCRLFSALTVRIRRSQQSLNGQNIGNALYSLNDKNDTIPEVREMLAALAFKVAASRAQLTGLDVAMSLYGN
jgi:hypothetical protein